METLLWGVRKLQGVEGLCSDMIKVGKHEMHIER